MGWGPQSKFRPISDAYREGMDRIAKNKAEKEAEEAKEAEKKAKLTNTEDYKQ